MYPEPTMPTPPPPPVESFSLSPSWWCSHCGHTNAPVSCGYFMLSRFTCERCQSLGNHNFSFSFVDLKIHGIQIMPPVRDQGCHPTCTIHAPLAAMELHFRRRAARNYQIFNKTLSWREVGCKYQTRMNCMFGGPDQGDKCWGRLNGMLDVLKEMGVSDEDEGIVYRIKSWEWRTMPFSEACQHMAAGRSLITVVPYMQHMLTLKANDAYSTKGYPEHLKNDYHVIVLIGGLREFKRDRFWFLDSHGEHNQTNGVAKILEADECLLGFGILEFY